MPLPQLRRVTTPFQECHQQLPVWHHWQIRLLNFKGSTNYPTLLCIINNLEAIHLPNCNSSFVSEDRTSIVNIWQPQTSNYYVLELNGSGENWQAILQLSPPQPKRALTCHPTLIPPLLFFILEQHPCANLARDQYSSNHSQKYSCLLTAGEKKKVSSTLLSQNIRRMNKIQFSNSRQ